MLIVTSNPMWTDVVEATAAVVGVVGVVLTLGSSALSQRKSARLQEAQFEMDLGSKIREIDRLFVERPELYPYFFDDSPVPASGDIRHQVLACAEFVIDVIADIATQKIHDRMKESQFKYWCDVLKTYYSNSPALRYKYEELKASYGNEMHLLLGVDN